MNDQVIYSIRDLVKVYGTRRVLDVAHLDIYRGEVLALVGPSGAGKSTLLRLLNFTEAPTSGRIRFRDTDVDGDRPVPLALRRRVTTVFQRPILLNRSVEANVRYGLRLRGRSEGGRPVQATLEQVGMAGLARQRARTLSGGEMQRVSLARAMVLQPDVLLLDEPTANLDPYNVGLIEEIICTLNREQGTTLVLVTHNVFQARRLAHRVGLLLDGRLIEVDEVERFFEQPQDARTAAFVRGDMVY
jgi:tungstate transport system ATP-binding protein